MQIAIGKFGGLGNNCRKEKHRCVERKTEKESSFLDVESDLPIKLVFTLRKILALVIPVGKILSGNVQSSIIQTSTRNGERSRRGQQQRKSRRDGEYLFVPIPEKGRFVWAVRLRDGCQLVR